MIKFVVIDFLSIFEYSYSCNNTFSVDAIISVSGYKAEVLAVVLPIRKEVSNNFEIWTRRQETIILPF